MNESKNQLKDYELFTTSDEETLQVASELKNIGCCPRCVLRFLGESNPASFRCQQQDIDTSFQCEGNEILGEQSLCPCPGCLGLLQKYAEKDFLLEILKKVREEGHNFTEYQCSLMLPVCLIVRQKAVYLHLRKKFGVVYPGEEDSIPTVKDVWKWRCGPEMTQLLGARFKNHSPYDIRITFNYPDSEKECSFLLNVDPDTFRRRKQKKHAFETFNRTNVGKALEEMTDSKFENCFTCPPSLPLKECTCVISCSHEAVFVAGRYLKFSRTLSQTPWIVEGKRIFEGSVEDYICDPMTEMFKPTEHRLSSSGREDVDVRMLGTGRPFVIELINPHCVKFSAEDMMQLQQTINKSTEDIQVRDLQIVARVDLAALKEGETDKTKVYSAICWCERELAQEDIDVLNGMKDLTIHQKTPLRVLHRRSMLTRDRVVYSMKPEKIDDNRFKLHLRTQAGTYIKEFIHGDFGRTSPNLCEILKAECDITDLDVEAVDVDWPPYIDPIPEGYCASQGKTETNDNLQPTDDVVNMETIDPSMEACKQSESEGTEPLVDK